METTEPIYHYTDAEGLHGIIKRRQVWATSYRFMSDAREIKYGYDLISEVYPSVDISDPQSLPPDFVKKMQDSRIAEMIRHWEGFYDFDGLFVASFSADGDSLGQWRGYAGLNSGYSLGFRYDAFKSIADTQLVTCSYNKEKQKKELKSIIDRYLPDLRIMFNDPDPFNFRNLATEAAKEMPGLFAKFKHQAFKDEKEWRLVVGPIWATNERIRYRPGERVIIPYVEIDFEAIGLQLKHIIVGPGPHQKRNVGSLRQMLGLHGFEGVKVSPSVIPFRTW